MADALDQFLEPSERVLFRRLRPWLPRHWRLGLAAAAAFSVLLGLVARDVIPMAPMPNLAFTGVVALALVGIYRASIWDQALETAVTERRIVSFIDRSEDRFRELAIDRIAAIDIARHSVLITTRDGEEIQIGQPDQAAAYGHAIAQAAGLAQPVLPHKAEAVAERLIVATWFVTWFGVFHASHTVIHAELGLATKLLMVTALLAGAIAVFPLLGLLLLILLRPFLTWAEMRAWIARTELLSDGPGLRRKVGWQRRFLLRFVDLLYGRPSSSPNQGSISQG